MHVHVSLYRLARTTLELVGVAAIIDWLFIPEAASLIMLVP